MTSRPRLLARNVDTGHVMATRVVLASRRVERAVGLLAHEKLEPDEALWIVPCRGVHTCGMRFAIDVVALDASSTVVDTVPALPPWRLRLPRRGAVSVLELPQGSLARTETRVGHRVELSLAASGSDDDGNGSR